MSIDIKIAPDLDEIVVSDTAISTEWNYGICYKADLKAVRAKMGDRSLKVAFQTAIALSSKQWQVADVLNRYLHLEGHMF